MSYIDPPDSDFRPITPPDPKGPDRVKLQQALGFVPQATPDLDAFARRAVNATGADIGGVNLVGADYEQFFPGMALRDAAPDAPPPPDENRHMTCEQGWCVYVVDRGVPMAINDILASPRFASNPVVEELGVRAYMGAPLLYEGEVIGTVWVVAMEVQAWTQHHINQMKAIADDVVTYLLRRRQSQ